MGRSARTDVHKIKPRSQTLPSSPTHSSSSSSDFEFTVSLSPRKSTTSLIPADELFYKGQLLPLHLSPRLSMVRTLLSSSSSTSSSSDTTTTASRDSTGSSSTSSSSSDHLLLLPDSRDSSRRPSSVTEDDSHTFARPLNFNFTANHHHHLPPNAKKPKYFSLSRFSSVFRKEPKLNNNNNQSDHTNLGSGSSVKRVSLTAKDVIRKYLKKVKPLYEKLSQKQGTTSSSRTSTILMTPILSEIACSKEKTRSKDNNGGTISHSFSGNLRYPRRKSCVSSCPSSMRSSPTHSGVLSRNGVTLMSKQFGIGTSGGSSSYNSESSTMEELQSAIQGAIAHCKNSMNIQTQRTTTTTNNTTTNMG